MADMKSAMRERNKTALNTLRALKTAIGNAAIDKGGAGTELAEGEIVSLIRKQIKQRQDSISQYESAGRDELADNERLEIEVLETYLPQPLSEAEIDALVTAAIEEAGASTRQHMGQVMKILQDKTDGRADGKTLSQKVMQQLS